ncbi:MAG: hypothetical protein AMJ69_08925, partial [Gammaproteobacteria bacterium SG8_47]
MRRGAIATGRATLTLALAVAGAAQAQQPALSDENEDLWALCSPLPPLVWVSDAARVEGPLDELVRVIAGGADLSEKGVTRLHGDVVLTYKGTAIHADEIRYHQDEQRIEAAGRVYYRRGDTEVVGRAADVDLDDQRGQIKDTRYQLPTMHAHGSASYIGIEGAERLSLSQATFSTCDTD